MAGKHIDLNGIIVDSKSGVSGAGRTPKLTTHFPECNESVSAYSVGQHRHTPEIEQVLTDVAGEPVEVIFTPHLMPMDRGIFTTIYADAAPALLRGRSCWRCTAPTTPSAPFVRMVERSAGHQGLHGHELPRRDGARGPRPDRRAGVRGQPGPRRQRRGGAELQPHVRPARDRRAAVKALSKGP